MIDLVRQSIRLAVLASALAGAVARTASAQQPIPQEPVPEEPQRLVDREPFDRIVLDAAGDGAVVEVRPIKFPGGKVPKDPRSTDTLRVNPLLYPSRTYEVAWRHVDRVETFSNMLLAEGVRLSEAAEYDEAYDYFARLRRDYRDTEGLDGAVPRFLFKNAGASFKAGRFDDALAMLEEVDSLDPKWPGLDVALAAVTDRVVQGHIRQGRYPAVKAFSERLAEQYGDRLKVKLDDWQREVQQIAQQKLDAAQAEFDAARYSQSQQACRRLLENWPGHPGAKRLMGELAAKYPRIVIGVTQPATVVEPGRMDNWASRRAGRLLFRTLVEFEGFGPQGGRYYSPWGTVQRDEDGRQLLVRLRDRGNDALPTGYDLSEQLLGMASQGDVRFTPAWAELAQSADVTRVFDVTVALRRPHLCPQALLQTRFLAAPSRDAREPVPDDPTVGPYEMAAPGREQTSFTVNERFILRAESQPLELVERVFRDSSESLAALRRGQIDVVDRLYPGDVDDAGAGVEITVAPYAVPSVHFLLPNYGRPFMASRTFRRALVYGIHRDAIVRQELLGGADVPGCRVVSGPMPPGKSDGDAVGYAYDERIAPRSYEPHLALKLALVAQGEFATLAEKSGRPAPELTPLVLAHPADEIPRVASQAIAEHLRAVGIDCETVELPPGRTAPPAGDWDLLYVETVQQEPLVDVPALLAADGLIGHNSAYVNQELLELAEATNWKAARERLHRVHRAARDEVSVIPLWQLVDHFAYRRELRGIEEKTVRLYQNVENWKTTPQPAPE